MPECCGCIYCCSNTEPCGFPYPDDIELICPFAMNRNIRYCYSCSWWDYNVKQCLLSKMDREYVCPLNDENTEVKE